MSSKKTDWKSKYYELRSRYMNAIDVSFRLGVQEGQKISELQNMQTQLQQAQQASAAGMAGGMPGGTGGAMPPEAGGMPPEMAGGEIPPEMAGGEEGVPTEAAPVEGEEEPASDEDEEDLGSFSEQPNALDASIQQLEDIVSKNEKIDFTKLMKSLHKSQVNQKPASEISERYKKIEKLLEDKNK